MKQQISASHIIKQLQALADADKVTFKANKYGIVACNALGIYQQDLKIIAKRMGVNSALALELFSTGIYEARLLCSKIFSPADVTPELMDQWVESFENWEICDSFCMGLFTKACALNPALLTHAINWTSQPQEFVKRAGFVVIAAYGFADKCATNTLFQSFLNPILREAWDDRIYVKKAISWALRNIGKRNIDLNKDAIKIARQLLACNLKPSRWIGRDVLREITRDNLKTLDYPRAPLNNEVLSLAFSAVRN